MVHGVLRSFADGVRALHPAEAPPPELPPIASMADVAPFADCLLAWLQAR